MPYYSLEDSADFHNCIVEFRERAWWHDFSNGIRTVRICVTKESNMLPRIELEPDFLDEINFDDFENIVATLTQDERRELKQKLRKH